MSRMRPFFWLKFAYSKKRVRLNKSIKNNNYNCNLKWFQIVIRNL